MAKIKSVFVCQECGNDLPRWMDQCVSCGAWNSIVEETPLSEPAIDLGIVAAIASLFRDLPVERSTVLIGEVGLSGEIRAVSHLEQRLKESANL